ncbi:unnamed protein product [Ceratitis capitata]|uniref:(Mediterranean fruit fly) hypothetical protein n=1 Tax=Ceratitis capitata TaxID=7213 RepID=A0A811VIJ0_CERCA|nr:unnamed protein product [Ceratitis capitata]
MATGREDETDVAAAVRGTIGTTPTLRRQFRFAATQWSIHHVIFLSAQKKWVRAFKKKEADYELYREDLAWVSVNLVKSQCGKLLTLHYKALLDYLVKSDYNRGGSKRGREERKRTAANTNNRRNRRSIFSNQQKPNRANFNGSAFDSHRINIYKIRIE